MIRKNLLAAVLAGLVSFLHAQQTMEEVVYLKNGSIIRGIIIEQVPNRTIKIQTADGNLFVYDVDEIEKLTKEPVFRGRNPAVRGRPQPAVPDAPEDKRAGRFSGMIQYAGLAVQHISSSDDVAYLKTSFVCGYRYRDFLFVGGGVGMEHMLGEFNGTYKLRIPVFATVRLNANHSRVSPYFQFDAGVRYDGDDYLENGFFFYPKVGLDFGLGVRRQRALFLSLSLFEYGNHPISTDRYYSSYDGDYYYSDSYDDFENGFYMKIGLQFGYRF
jgi:hypothetical protein